jgi:hypothetical protein
MVVPLSHVRRASRQSCLPLNSQNLLQYQLSRPIGTDMPIYSSPFPLPTYATDVLLGGVCVFRGRRVRPVELLNIGLVVLWHKLRLLLRPLPKFITPREEILKILWSVTRAALHGRGRAVGPEEERCIGQQGAGSACASSARQLGKKARLKKGRAE